MAGGKESPRQKMIGMMYLVLTALLALQVSSAIIEKFKFLDDSLQYAKKQGESNNVTVQKKIQKAVNDAGNKGPDMVVLNKADEVRKETTKMIGELDNLRDELIKITGGKEEDGGYKGAKEETAVEVLMVGPEGSKKGKGYTLQKNLNDYAKKISTIVGEHELPYRPIALDAKDDEMLKKNKDQRNKDFANLNFAQTPMVAALAVISTKQAEVLKLESMALEELATQVGAADLKFDNVFAMVRANSKVVAAGTKYEADLFIAASSSALTPKMKYEGKDIPVQGGFGKVSFVATPGAYDKDGNAKKTWKGSITINNKGADTTFAVTEEYIVARPVISVQSASVSALYKNCGNELNVQVPALGSTYNPSFSASGAQVISGGEKGKVTLVPTAAKVTLNVASGGNAIGSQDFAVRLIPRPSIEALSNGRMVDEKKGVPAPGPRSIVMKAIPDESFKAFLPKDARYKITQWEAILVRGKRPVSTQVYSSEVGNFSAFTAQAQPGDRILIEVKKVQRMNFLNKVEDVNVGTVIKNIPLN